MAAPMSPAVAIALATALQTEPDEKDDFLVILPAIAAIIERNERARIRHFVDETVPGYTNEIFRRMFRMTSETYEVLLSYLQERLELQVKGVGRQAIPISKQILITLWYLGGQDTIQKIADRFGVSESSVVMSKTRIIDALISLQSKFIKWPGNEEIRQEINTFALRNGFPGIVGALDGTHVRIKAPSESGQAYVNRKQFHSIQLQAVCRHNLMFSDCFVGSPGSWHDARVLRSSDLWDQGLALCGFQNHILADAAYPLRRWILTPYRNNGHLTNEQKRYNHLHSSNRVVVERAFGLLKGRFKRLTCVETKAVEDTVKVIMACCVLHNICLLHHDECEDFLQADNGIIYRIPAGIVIENEAEGVLKRDAIARRLRN